MNNKINRKGAGNLTLTGFFIGLLMIGLIASSFGIFMSDLVVKYNVTDESNIFSNYTITNDIVEDVAEIRNSTNIEQAEGWSLDFIGGYFSAGYNSLKITFQSFRLFENIISSSENDILFLERYKIGLFIKTIVLILLIVGIMMSALLKVKL